ncbi:MAG: hypothetical protein COA78_16720 [Blastopirellula sp.]|nr:MAG: hypothetical protein COA78_16720 [Blastopirellula sp.]
MTEKNEINPFEAPQDVQSDSSEDLLPVTLPVSIVLLLVCIFLFFVHPGLGVFGILISIPGVIHGVLKIQRNRARQGSIARGVQIDSILISLFTMIPITFASMIGFGIFCFGGVAVIGPLAQNIEHSESRVAVILFAGGISGLFAYLVIGTLLFFNTLPKKQTGSPEIEDEDT